ADDPANVEMAERTLPRVPRRRVGAENGCTAGACAAQERRDRAGRFDGRLERDRVPDAGELDEPRLRDRARELAAVLGQRPVVVGPDDDEGWVRDLPETVAEALRTCDRATLAHVVDGIVLEQPRAVVVEHRRVASQGRFGERRVLRPDVVHPDLQAVALDALRGCVHPRSEVGQVRLGTDQHERADLVRPLERVLQRDRRTEGGADEHRPVEVECAHGAPEVVRPSCKRELSALELTRAAGTAQIDDDEPVAVAEAGAHPLPERSREAEAVHEHDRPALARDLDVELRAVDCDPVGHASVPTASTIACTEGAYAFSSDGVNGTGACGAVTRRTGPFSESNACSETAAAISDATLQCGGLSSTTTSAPVFSTDATIVSRSSGDTVRGSITSALVPDAASRSAASRARSTIAEIATIVTSLPARRTSATPSGILYGSSGTGP